jgi:hypothetical protein
MVSPQPKTTITLKVSLANRRSIVCHDYPSSGIFSEKNSIVIVIRTVSAKCSLIMLTSKTLVTWSEWPCATTASLSLATSEH